MKDWKTTIAGLIAGAITILQTILANMQNGTPINWAQIGIGFAIIALGVFAKDIGGTTALMLILASPLLNGCASTQTAIVSGTLSNGDKFPLCLEVTQPSPIGGVTLIAAFCANVQSQIDTKVAEYRTLYPNATVTELVGTESRKL
jgi:hypothetical protein